jgi:O-antigen/teichoic acid export membrane protein/glycosyltransferase involved in cell wall biosynthesis
MRILLITPMVPDREGAGAIPLLLHAELGDLLERHQVTLVTAFGDDPRERAAVEVLTRAEVDVHLADRRQPPPGLRRWRRRTRLAAKWASHRWPWRTVWFADPAIQKLIDQVGAAQQFDVVAVEDSSMAVFRLPSGTPTVFTEHEVRRPRRVDWRPGPPSRWPGWARQEIDWRRWSGYQRQIWQRFDRVQTFSRSDAEAIARLAPEVAERVRVNPFGVDLPPASDPAAVVPGTILFTGQFSHPPNRDAAVWLARDIMPVVLDLYPEARLQIAGSGAPREVRDLAAPEVDVIVDPPSIQPYMDSASLVVAPVRTGGGMRMKVLQALAAGKPVVTTPRGAEGFLEFEAEPPMVVAEDAPGIGAAIAELLGNESRRWALGRRARQFAERHHSPAAWGERLDRIHAEAAASAPETRPTRATPLRRLAADPLLRNGVYIMGKTAAPALMGFAFWIIAARTLSATEVGQAAALVSAMLLVSVFTNLGLGQVYITRLPDRRDPEDWSLTVSTGLLLAGGASLAGGALAAVLLATVDSAFAGVPALVFVLLPAGVAATAWFLLLDHVYIAERDARPAFVRNTAAGLVRLLLVALIAIAPFDGVSWIVLTWVAAFLFFDLLSVVRGLPSLRPGTRPRIQGWRQEWGAIRRLIVGHQAINLGAQSSAYVLPLIVAVRLGPADNAYFYASFMLATSVTFIAPAIGDSLFAEGAHDPDNLRRDTRRAARQIAILAAGPALVLLLAGPEILELFGKGYSEAGGTLLRILVGTAVFSAGYILALAVLRARRQLRDGAVATFAQLIITLTAAWVLLPPLGLEGAGWGAAIGSATGMFIAVAFVLWGGGRPARADTTAGFAQAGRET